MKAKLTLQDGTILGAESFGAETATAGEVVFSTGMMGYPESLTDPSYKGQILVLTYPLVGNYGVPNKELWESGELMVSGLVVSQYNETPSHFQSQRTLAEWFKDENKPLIEIKDTRLLTQRIREHGTILGKIEFNKKIDFYDPNNVNLVEQVSTKKVTRQAAKDLQDSSSSKRRELRSLPTNSSRLRSNNKNNTILLIDCGAKKNIQRGLLQRGVNVITVPWDYDIFNKKNQEELGEFNAIVISNGPGNPKMADKTIETIKKILDAKIPLLGICLGHQLLSLAAGGNTKKLKYGHRSQNQPCAMENTDRCYITTQNHGFAVSEIPPGFKAWFTNANDNTNEGIIHTKRPVMSVQFHPEATPGPVDTEWIFDYFLEI